MPRSRGSILPGTSEEKQDAGAEAEGVRGARKESRAEAGVQGFGAGALSSALTCSERLLRGLPLAALLRADGMEVGRAQGAQR